MHIANYHSVLEPLELRGASIRFSLFKSSVTSSTSFLTGYLYQYSCYGRGTLKERIICGRSVLRDLVEYEAFHGVLASADIAKSPKFAFLLENLQMHLLNLDATSLVLEEFEDRSDMANYLSSDDDAPLLKHTVTGEEDDDDPLLEDHHVSPPRGSEDPENHSSVVVYPPPTTGVFDVGTRRKVCTMIVMTCINLLNYMDRFSIAGEISQV